MPLKISSLTIKQALNQAIFSLKRSHIPEAFLDAQILLSNILKKDRSWILAHDDKKLNKNQYTNYNKLISKRIKHWPVAYLLGEKEFYSRKFLVNKNVLVPRPESELIIETVLNKINQENKTFSLIDIGTGSGCLIITALLEDKLKKIKQATAIDVSAKALEIAKKNAKQYKLNKKIKFIKNNLLKKFNFKSLAKTDEIIILANLPYLKTSEMKEPSIKHEPKKALAAGKDGLKYYRELKQQIKNINQKITLICEINPGQKNGFKKIWSQAKFKKDLAGKTRVGMVKGKDKY